MPNPQAAAAGRHGSRRAVIALAAALIVGAVAAAWYWQAEPIPAPAVEQAPQAAAAPGKEPEAQPSTKTDFPAGAAAISGPEIVAALSDHTALLPGGFVEYYAPDGTIHGVTQDKHYGGSWTVKQGDFCTLLQDSNDSICSPVERRGTTLYWSMDGEEEASPVIVVPGNPRHL